MDVQATSSSTLGSITVEGDHSGNITVGNTAGWTVHIEGDYTGIFTVASFGGNGSLQIDGDLAAPGRVEITGNLTQNAQIKVLGDVNNTDDPPIHVHGSIVDGSSPDAARPLIVIGDAGTDELSGTVAIDGGIANAYASGPEITVTALAMTGASGPGRQPLLAWRLQPQCHHRGRLWRLHVRR